jgi:hypothetical protein
MLVNIRAKNCVGFVIGDVETSFSAALQLYSTYVANGCF